MANVTLEIPQEIVDHLGQSALASLDEAERVRVALAIHLFTTEQVSLGRAAELSGYALADFWDLLGSLGLSYVNYDLEEYRRDQETVERWRERQALDRSR